MGWLVAAAALSLVCSSSSFTATIPSISILLPRPSLHADQGLVDHSSSKVFIPGASCLSLCKSFIFLLLTPPERLFLIVGNGYSGFFYTLGWLRSLEEAHGSEEDFTYQCYSGGCLALVAHLLDVELEVALDLAIGSRERLLAGDIGRYEVVERFVDGLLDFAKTTHEVVIENDHCPTMVCQAMLDRNETRSTEWFSRLSIITSSWSYNNTYFLEKNVRRPSSTEDLKSLLLDTTFIPFLTGETFGRAKSNLAQHNDGALAVWFDNLIGRQSSSSGHVLRLPKTLLLWSNIFNMWLDRKTAVQIWNEGTNAFSRV